MLLTDRPLEAFPLAVVFAATMFVYTVNRFTDLAEDERNVPGRASFTRRYGLGWLAAGVGIYVLVVAVAVALGQPGAIYLLAPLVAAVLYSVVGIKRVLLVKNLFVGAAWACIPLGVGYYYEILLTPEILVLVGYIGSMITVAAVVFDIKDVEGDRREGISTVPILLGPRRTRIGAQVANVLVAGGVFAVVAAGVVPTTFLVLFAMNGYVAAYIPFAHPDHGPLFYGFVVDGEHVFLAAVVVALEWLVW
ncbi:UbiA family prenyltransferase [Natrarchaeobaculum aegyptiacum]|nr:UbiA family prenyltransferase [Natrarchaeobaculum aegyptiacum]